MLSPLTILYNRILIQQSFHEKKRAARGSYLMDALLSSGDEDMHRIHSLTHELLIAKSRERKK